MTTTNRLLLASFILLSFIGLTVRQVLVTATPETLVSHKATAHQETGHTLYSQNAETAFATDQNGSSGTTQSRPFPARAVKREESAGHYAMSRAGRDSKAPTAQPASFPLVELVTERTSR